MRIVLQNKSQKERRLYVPNALLMNRLTAFWITRELEKHGIQLPHGQIRRFVQSFKAVRERHPDWVLMEAEPSSGDKIKIIV